MDVITYLNDMTQNVEDRILEVRKNHIKIEQYIVFVLIGTEQNESKPSMENKYIRYKAKLLLSDPHTCDVIDLPAFDINAEVDYSIIVSSLIEKTVKKAADDHVNVLDLNTIYVCPVVIGSNTQGQYTGQILTGIKQYSQKSHKNIRWQPFVLIQNSTNKVEENQNTISALHEFFLSEETCTKCCVLSDVDENGFTVEYENNLGVIVLAAILQVVGNKGARNSCTTYQQMLVKKDDNWCFTAKNATISLPIRSITLRRVLSVFNAFFLKQTNLNTWERMEISLNDFLEPYYNRLVNDNGSISTYPLYAAPVEYPEQILKYITKKYYHDQMLGVADEEGIQNQLYNYILDEFFNQNGSLRDIVNITDDSRKSLREKSKFLTYPVTSKPDISAKNQRKFELHQKYEDNLKRWLSLFGQKLLEKVVASERFRYDLPKKASLLIFRINDILQNVKNQIKKYESSEIVTVVQSTPIDSDLEAYTDHWFENTSNRNSQTVAHANMKFNKAIMKMLTGVEDDVNDDLKLLEICFNYVKDNQESFSKYMMQVSETCNVDQSRADEIAQKSDLCLTYPIRIMKSKKDNHTDTIIIGNSGNSLPSILANRLNAKILNIEDTSIIEIFRTSTPFSHRDLTFIYEKEEIVG